MDYSSFADKHSKMTNKASQLDLRYSRPTTNPVSQPIPMSSNYQVQVPSDFHVDLSSINNLGNNSHSQIQQQQMYTTTTTAPGSGYLHATSPSTSQTQQNTNRSSNQQLSYPHHHQMHISDPSVQQHVTNIQMHQLSQLSSNVSINPIQHSAQIQRQPPQHDPNLIAVALTGSAPVSYTNNNTIPTASNHSSSIQIHSHPNGPRQACSRQLHTSSTSISHNSYQQQQIQKISHPQFSVQQHNDISFHTQPSNIKSESDSHSVPLQHSLVHHRQQPSNTQSMTMANTSNFQTMNVMLDTSNMSQFSPLQHQSGQHSSQTINNNNSADPASTDPAAAAAAAAMAMEIGTGRHAKPSITSQNVGYVSNSTISAQPQPYVHTPASSQNNTQSLQSLPIASRKRKVVEMDDTSFDAASTPPTTSSSMSSQTGTASLNEPLHLANPMSHAEPETDLSDLAERLRSAEQGPQAEKVRQSFAALWLQQKCVLSEGYVIPRNRIHSRYVDACSRHSIKPLNPASFGKLVRAAYPNIKTRRLGVRGCSKYHYCGFRLADDLNESTGDTPVSTPRDFGRSSESIASSSRVSDTTPSVFGASCLSQSTYSTPSRVRNARSRGSDSILTELDTVLNPSLDYLSLSSDPVNLNEGKPKLKFHRTVARYANLFRYVIALEDFQIPGIDKFIPQYTKPELVKSLCAAYLSHCQSLIEATRSMDLKAFWACLNSFVGELPLPVKKLLQSESLINWVYLTDLKMYKTMVNSISHWAFGELSLNVLNGLRSLSQILPAQLESSLLDMPEKFVQAKLKPAKEFASLLQRLISVNKMGLQASKIFVNHKEVCKMRNDWKKYVDPKSIVAREAPCGGAQLERILGEDVVNILNECEQAANSRKDAPEDFENQPGSSAGDSAFETTASDLETVAGSAPSSAGSSSSLAKAEPEGTPKPDTVLQKWAEYLSDLPLQFPQVSTRLFMLFMNSLLTACLREISMNNGDGFGAWWVVQCWIDEWMRWSAEMGGFLAMPEQFGNANGDAVCDASDTVIASKTSAGGSNDTVSDSIVLSLDSMCSMNQEMSNSVEGALQEMEAMDGDQGSLVVSKHRVSRSMYLPRQPVKVGRMCSESDIKLPPQGTFNAGNRLPGSASSNPELSSNGQQDQKPSRRELSIVSRMAIDLQNM